MSECSVGALAETALWILPKGWLCAVGAKANVPFAGRHKIELKKMCGGENKKYRRVGNECRLTRCPFLISFLCPWSPVKMVCSYVNVQFLVVCLMVALSSFRLTGNLLIPLIFCTFVRVIQRKVLYNPETRQGLFLIQI